MDATTREQIAERLRESPATPSDLADAFDVTTASAIEHARHLARSLEHDAGQLQVAPPTCEDCGFEDFDDLANVPSRCPDCKSEAVSEPVFRIFD